MISSRTPEGWFHRCAVCGQDVRVEPSMPTRDAPCPHCGSLEWFDTSDEFRIEGDDIELAMGLWEMAGCPPRVLLDFTGATFMNSAHLGLLIRMHQRLTQVGGRLSVVGLNEDILDVFRLTKLDQMLHIVGDEADTEEDEPEPDDEESDWEDD